MSMKKKEGEPTLGKWIIQKYNTKLGRENGLGAVRKTEQIQELLDLLGSRNLMNQAKELKNEGYLSIQWGNVNTEVRTLSIFIDRLDDLCQRENVVNPRILFEEKRILLTKWFEEFRDVEELKREEFQWIVKFYEKLLDQLERAKKDIPQNARDEKLLLCLNGIARLEEDVWKRKFSVDILANSKEFEDKYQRKVVSILTTYSEKVSDKMEADEVLAQHRVFSYSQTLELKGGITYRLDTPFAKEEIDTSSAYYGHILNAQTLSHSKVIGTDKIEKVITIENKANYESMVYDNTCLYIYTHGFLSYKERVFLQSLEKNLSEDVQFYHWSDMDYGGIRIFNFMKSVFPERKLIPWRMGRDDYMRAFAEGKGIPIELEKRKKIEEIETRELEELKQCILEYGREFEQEQLID